MRPLAPYISQASGHGSGQPCCPSEDSIFGPPPSAPTLNETHTNRIFVFPGSFNPPHQGHLQLLNYAFYHGVHDWNVIAAIVVPSDDNHVSGKCKRKGSTFMFGLNERCLLWKRDPGFPKWAWVFEGVSRNFSAFRSDLKAATSKDGYEVEFINLYGPDCVSPRYFPDIGQTILVCDAARAADFQRSNGRLKNFRKFTNWRGVNVDKMQLEILLRAKAELALVALKDASPEEARTMTEVCPNYIDMITQARLAAASRDLQHVIFCKMRVASKETTLRFIKYSGGESPSRSATAEKGSVEQENKGQRNDVCSTKLRNAMRSQKGKKLKASLDKMALSSHLLWWHSPIWLNKARLGNGFCINFPHLDSPEHKDEFDESSRKRRLSVAFGVEDDTPSLPPTKRRRAASV